MSTRAALAEDKTFKISFSKKRCQDVLECPKETLSVLFFRVKMSRCTFATFYHIFYQIQQKYHKIHIKENFFKLQICSLF